MIAPSGPPGWLGEAKLKVGEESVRSIRMIRFRRSCHATNSWTLVSVVPIRCYVMPHLLSRSSGLRPVHEEALLPPHVFAPMSPRQSVRSPEGNYSGEPIPAEQSTPRDVADTSHSSQKWQTSPRDQMCTLQWRTRHGRGRRTPGAFVIRIQTSHVSTSSRTTPMTPATLCARFGAIVHTLRQAASIVPLRLAQWRSMAL